jgi:hypothetical protein
VERDLSKEMAYYSSKEVGDLLLALDAAVVASQLPPYVVLGVLEQFKRDLMDASLSNAEVE